MHGTSPNSVSAIGFAAQNALHFANTQNVSGNIDKIANKGAKQMKTILITGGAGFMCSNFVNHILHKYPNNKIVVLDAPTYAGNIDNIPDKIKKSKRFEFWYGNVTNDDLVDTLVSRCDVVVHFAAENPCGAFNF